MSQFINSLISQAAVNLFVGFGLALLNVIIRYFVPPVPRVVSVTRWGLRWPMIILIYTILFVVQLLTSPFFRAFNVSVTEEIGLSFYQAFFNLVGILLMDLIVGAWEKARSGVAAGRKQFDVVKERAADQLDDLGAHLPLTGEQRAEQEARRQAREEAEAQSVAERKKRVDDRLKDY